MFYTELQQKLSTQIKKDNIYTMLQICHTTLKPFILGMFSTHVYLLIEFYLCLAAIIQKLLSEIDVCVILKNLLLQMMSDKIYVSSE